MTDPSKETVLKTAEEGRRIYAEMGATPVINAIGNRTFLGGSALFSLVKFTSEAYPLPTGGMPIVSLPPAGVITFEGVAIGAILCTVGTVLYECGLPRLKGLGPLDQHLAEDHVLVSVECEEGVPEAWTANALETERV